MANETVSVILTGRCYCGAVTIETIQAPQTVTYCHCNDCRRVTGSPVSAFAAFDESAVTFEPNEGRSVTVSPGVTRSFCETCGSPLAGRYEYLPGQVYVGVGLFDQADELAPLMHAHDSQRLAWFHVDDGLERFAGSARSELSETSR